MVDYLHVDRKWDKLANDAEYKPSRLARVCGVSLRTLQRHFSEKYSVTISAWLTSVRLRAAYARIVAGDRVKEVAFDLGYKQLSHFSREFKRFHGIAPSFLNRRLSSEKNGTIIKIEPALTGEATFNSQNS